MRSSEISKKFVAASQEKLTSGTSRFSGDSISRKLASSNLNMPAMMLLGKFSDANDVNNDKPASGSSCAVLCVKEVHNSA